MIERFTIKCGPGEEYRAAEKINEIIDWINKHEQASVPAKKEEPKEFWYIDCYGTVIHSLDNGNEWDECRKEIGKQRLKDKGFRFVGWCDSSERMDRPTLKPKKKPRKQRNACVFVTARAIERIKDAAKKEIEEVKNEAQK